MKYLLSICASSDDCRLGARPNGLPRPTRWRRPLQLRRNSSTAPLQVSDKPVAKVNGAVLTDRDLLREMYTIFPYAQQHRRISQIPGSGHPPGRSADDHLRRTGVPGGGASQVDRSAEKMSQAESGVPKAVQES